MSSPSPAAASSGRWTSLWVTAAISLVAHLWLCQFFTFGQKVPLSIDIDPSNLWKYAYTFPPTGSFQVLNWLGVPYYPFPLNPCSLAANLPAWLFFTTFAPLVATCSLIMMAAFLRELDLPRPAALFGGVVYAWQGDLIPFVFPGHYAYITTWFFFALATWAALRAQRTGLWPYAMISGVSTGLMIGLQPDRGAIASLLVGAFYLFPAIRRVKERPQRLRHFAICVATAFLVSLAPFLALFKGNIVGVSLGGSVDRNSTYQVATQYSLGPEETLTYVAPGIFGWYTGSKDASYWGPIGQGVANGRSFNLAISTTGTMATLLAFIGILTLVPGRLLGPAQLTERQHFFGRMLLTLGAITLILAWGYHTPFYRPLFALPLMDKWRNPLKWLEITNFALAALSAYGVQHLIASLREDDGTRVLRRRLTWFWGVMLALAGAGVLVSYPYTAFALKDILFLQQIDPGLIANTMGTLISSTWFAFFLTLLFGLLLRTLWHPGRLPQWSPPNPMLSRLWQEMFTPRYLPLTLAGGLAALCMVQLAWVDTHFIQPTEFRLLTESDPLIDRLKSEGDRVRVAAPIRDPMLNMLLQNQFYAARISCLDISAASRIPDDLYAFLGTLGDNRARLWMLAGVKNLVVPQQGMDELQKDPAVAANVAMASGYMLFGGTSSTEDLPSHAVVLMHDYLEKATFVPRSEILPSNEAILKRLKDPAWNPRESVLLDKTSPGILPPLAHTEGIEAGSVNLEAYTPHRITMTTHSKAGGYVLINDAYDPDWKVKVNGQRAPLLRADFMMRAIAVPPGDATISLHYIAHYGPIPALIASLFSDAVMLLAWIVAGLALWRMKPATPASGASRSE